MSPSPSPKPRSSTSKANIGAAPILGDPLLLQNPRLIHIANQLANWKCWKALQEGQIQVVHRRKSSSRLYIPRTDIVDNPASPTVDAIFEVPGIRGDDIRVTLMEGHLVVHGIRRPIYRPEPMAHQVEDSLHSIDIDPQSSNPRTPPVRELRYGAFQRRVKLPDGIKDADISAKLADGMLRVSWPRIPGSNDSETGVKSELSSPSLDARAMSTSPEPPERKATAGTALQ
jgi:HSP20 family protein